MDQEDHVTNVITILFFPKVTVKVYAQNISWITVELEGLAILCR